MVQLILIRSLLCNVLIAWATLHKLLLPPPGHSLSSPPPQNKNQWVHPVIFKPQPKIQLTQSSYKVTSFLDFEPFLKGFQSFYQYLEDLTEHLNNPIYIQRLIYQVKPFQMTPSSNESPIQEFFNTEICRHNPFGCKSKLKFEQDKWRSNILIKCFMLFIENFLQP